MLLLIPFFAPSYPSESNELLASLSALEDGEKSNLSLLFTDTTSEKDSYELGFHNVFAILSYLGITLCNPQALVDDEVAVLRAEIIGGSASHWNSACTRTSVRFVDPAYGKGETFPFSILVSHHFIPSCSLLHSRALAMLMAFLLMRISFLALYIYIIELSDHDLRVVQSMIAYFLKRMIKMIYGPNHR